MSDQGTSPRFEQLQRDHHQLRHDMNNAIQVVNAHIGRMEASIKVFEERDRHEQARQAESARWRDEQLNNIRTSINELRTSMGERFSSMEAKMVTKKENLPSNILGVSAIIAGIVALGGFVVQAWHWTGGGK